MEVILRRWEPEDARQLAEIAGNSKIQDNLRDGLPYPYSVEDARQFISAMRSADPSSVFPFAVTAEGEVVGSLGVFRRENIHFRTAELGYYIGEPYWGRGYATSAVRQACAYIFHHTDILRIFAEPFAYNIPSCRVLEKAGFELEGVLRCNAVKKGRVLDMKLYALLRQDVQETERNGMG